MDILIHKNQIYIMNVLQFSSKRESKVLLVHKKGYKDIFRNSTVDTFKHPPISLSLLHKRQRQIDS
jgi:hypothetical protein